mmetsp:Transcript_33765/g.75847  ORF Transcript_33765/g.75847 Transcript_33765/m.75847 type:complete len:94 (-) Transcript_33765:1098-1379(-)
MYLLGDAAYKSIPNVLTPFEGTNLPIWKDSFNFHLSQLRINVECAFGMLINRFGIFWRGIRSHDDMFLPALIIDVCMMLHNFIIDTDKSQKTE